MVYMSGSRSARNQSSICNRTNTCGGMKKGGLAPSIGVFVSSNPSGRRLTNTMMNLMCIPNHTTQTQSYGYRATHTGRMG